MIQDASYLLKKYWGHEQLHHSQERAIESILAGSDTLVVMPTGGGKSICYQLPALMCVGCVIVVSPLIALMEDQVKALRRRKIPARYINSNLSREESMQYMQEFVTGELKLLYITPERIQSESFIESAQYANVPFIAVDEAHCISMWGHDFRPSYRFISRLRTLFPQSPIMALTATATPRVAQDLCENLSFTQPYTTIYQSFRRENLEYSIDLSPHRHRRLLELLSDENGSAIVYCGTKNSIQEIEQMLSANGISATQYHAGLSAAIRSRALREWLNGEKRVMVATSAFGMGIDKADVRLVLHWHIPPTVEDYFQQAGRAGRDGQYARAIILADEKSIATMDYLSGLLPSGEELMEVYTRLCNMFSVGYGDYPDEVFQFSFDEYCKRYNIKDKSQARALFSYLVRYGIISFYGNEVFSSRAMIRASIEECYQMGENSLSRILESLIRSSEGIFSYMSPVDVEKCAAASGLRVQDFLSGMEQLKKMGVVDWIPAGQYSMLHFCNTRNDESIMAHIRYSLRQSENIRRDGAAKMKEYIYTTTCRARWIESYFGMNEGIECGMCDICRK